jgi:SAM-dependent methyltransferase
MAPSIVWEELLDVANKSLRVLDPMAGSGTAVAMARLLGHQVTGFDTDPLAVLIARAWSSDVDPAELRDAARDVTEESRLRAREMALGDAYPAGADEKMKEFVRYWYDPTARRHLTALSTTIGETRNTRLRTLLWCAFSRLIITKSMGASLAMDISHSRPHKVYDVGPIKPLAYFERAAGTVAKNAPFARDAMAPAAAVRRGDARDLPVDDQSVDVVITSPPYGNAIDYMRGHRFSLVWMGHTMDSLRTIRSTNVGSEVGKRNASDVIERITRHMGDVGSLSTRAIGLLHRYVADMDGVMREMARVLVPEGHAVLVVGDSTIRGVFVKNSVALEHLGKRHGLKLVKVRRRPLPPNRRYLPPPCASGVGDQLKTRMRDEVILRFEKSA